MAHRLQIPNITEVTPFVTCRQSASALGSGKGCYHLRAEPVSQRIFMSLRQHHSPDRAHACSVHSPHHMHARVSPLSHDGQMQYLLPYSLQT